MSAGLNRLCSLTYTLPRQKITLTLGNSRMMEKILSNGPSIYDVSDTRKLEPDQLLVAMNICM